MKKKKIRMKKEKQIKTDWQIIGETKDRLAISIKEAELNYAAIAESLIMAQKLNNQIDFFEEQYGIPNKEISEKLFLQMKNERNGLYQQLYVIFDKISNDEMIGYIKKSLDVRIAEYKIFIQDIASSSNEYVLKMLDSRDEIKYLYDEMDIWTGRWSKREDRIETCDITDKFCQEIGGLDVIFRKYIIENDERFKFINQEAQKRLIKKPDGSKRFDFWWWFILK